MRVHVFALLALVFGCASRPTASEVCKKIEGAGLGKNCRETSPKGLNARARHMVDFDLPSVPGKGAGVLEFEKDDDYEATVKAFEAAALLAGPHRYGNAKARIFVQANDKLGLAEGNKLRALIEGL